MSKQMAQLVREQRNGDEAVDPDAAPNVYAVTTLDFRNWHLFDEIPEDAFTMAVPPEYEEVESVRHLMLNPDVDPKVLDRDRDAVLELLGQPAPNFESESWDDPDQPVSLPRDTDSVLIIDFWATWCVPCIRAMPELIAVAEANADRGVALFAVNVGESRERIERFLQDHDWNVDILMDENRETFERFDGTSLPTTIVIDRAGVVRQIHRGYSPELKERLQSEIDEILAEQSEEG
ncbi:MAG: TlpA family protein disulfide reductase [Phycisphaerales bacterium]|nr:MAG: TlpA family protein disulfide reductase [Phycisphaerales bacterium]